MKARDEIVLEYLEQLRFAPYAVQEEALLAWGECEEGVLVSAPTGTGKTLVAEGAVWEGLKLGRRVYYSTPLIALTEQKFLELQAAVEGWGYSREMVGMVTGHRSVNASAPILVVVAEVLLNRLLHREAFDFSDVCAVVMDEFHNFNEPQRGIVWELSLALLPKTVRVMLLSATVGAAQEFVGWMANSLDRRVVLVEGKERKVPLVYQWVGDELLPDFMERIALGADAARRTPALVFCFDRAVCWDVAEVLKGKDLFGPGQRDLLLKRLDDFEFKVGAGAKIRTFLARGIGIHHAGLLPRYRRVVETLFQEKLLPVCVCTETLAAGINLPARSVVLTTLVKGPRDKKKLIEPSSVQQIFGRAGRPQFDTEGHVYAMAHEDDVKIAKWQEKYDSIPETDKDPKMMSAKKALLKKKPTRRNNVTYWNAEQFVKLQTAPPSKLASRGKLSWRWIAYLLEASPEVEKIREVVRRRLMDPAGKEAELKRLTKMLVTLEQLGVVKLTPPPPASWKQVKGEGTAEVEVKEEESEEEEAPVGFEALVGRLTLGGGKSAPVPAAVKKGAAAAVVPVVEAYEPMLAEGTEKLKLVTLFRAIHPIYGLWLVDYLGLGDAAEVIQIMESLLEMPGSVAKFMRVPKPADMAPGRLAVEVVDPGLLTKGLASVEEMYPSPIEEQLDVPPELRKYPIALADKVKRLFEHEVDHAGGLFVTPVWAVGDLLDRGGEFDGYVRSRDLVKQEGILFKHVLRMVLLCKEMETVTPRGVSSEEWKQRLGEMAGKLTAACRAVDAQSTDEMLEELEEDA